MKKNNSMIFYKSANLLLFLLGLSGCIGYHELLPPEVPQYSNCTKKGVKKINKETKNNLRQVKIYDRFETVALFDFLRYSDSVAIACGEAKSDKFAISSRSERLKVLSSEVAKNQGEFLFLLQADVRNSVQPSIEKEGSPWSFFLITSDGVKNSPSSICKIEHTEYTRALFGKAYSKFKTLYKIAFPLSGQVIEQARRRTQAVSIICKSKDHECEIHWESAAI